MKRFLLLFLAFFTAFGALNLATSRDAEAQVSLELVGKLGGTSNYFDDEWLGDTKFGVSGGLRFATLVRFANNFGVGLNLNWTMTDQKLQVKGLAEALGDDSRRYAVVQHPSFGITFRYLVIDMIDLGLWMNYGFGSVNFDPIEPTAEHAQAALDMNYNVGTLRAPEYVSLEYQLQTFELGLLAHCRWYVPNTTLAIIVGAEFFMNFSSMESEDTRMHSVVYHNKKHLDENSTQSFGFQFVFGLGYDFYLDAFGKSSPNT